VFGEYLQRRPGFRLTDAPCSTAATVNSYGLLVPSPSLGLVEVSVQPESEADRC